MVKKSREEKWNVWSLEGGLETLIESLSQKLKQDGVEIQMNSQETSKNDFTFYTTPAFATSKMIENETLTSLLDSIPFVDVAVINYRFETVENLNPGFGFLVPSSQEKVPILGVIFDTCSFPQENSTIFTVMMGGAWFESLFGQNPPEQELVEIGLNHLKSILKIEKEPVQVVCKLHRNCIAQYTVGHGQRVEKMRQIIKNEDLNLALVGSSYDGVGLNDAVLSSRIQVEQFYSNKA